MIAPAENAVPKLLLSLSESALALSCCERTVTRLIERGELKPVKIGPRGIRISVSELQAWIANQQEASA